MTEENEAQPVLPKKDQIAINLESTKPDDKVNCWVCFGGTEDDKEDTEWVQPCKCRGTTKWVHQTCLQRWIDEKQGGNISATVCCPQCNANYILTFPPFGRFVCVLDLADRIICKVCPLATAGIVVGSIYWIAVTYGAVTVMQILGHREGLSIMEQTDPLFLLVGLPTIPIILILGKMVRWEEYLLDLCRRYWNRLPLLSKLFGGAVMGNSTPLPGPSSGPVPVPPQPEQELEGDVPAFSDPVSATRVLCGALILPTMATISGKVFFKHITHNPKRTLLGGITFISLKGVLKMYLRQQQHIRQCQRKIMNFDKSAVALPPDSPMSSASFSQSDSGSTSSSSDF